MSSIDLEDMLCFALYQANKAMTARYRPLLESLDLTYPQYLVMISLWNDGALSVSQLGERLGLDSGTLSPLLKRLEVRGFVTRARADSDERKVVVGLTERGNSLRTEAASIPAQLLCGVDVDPGDFAALVRTLHELTVQLNNPVLGAAS